MSDRDKSSSSSSGSGSGSGSGSDSDSSDSDVEIEDKKNGTGNEEENDRSSRSVKTAGPADQTAEKVDGVPPTAEPAARASRSIDLITGGPSGGRTGGVYVPPFKLAMMRKAMGAVDKSSQESQKQSWEALRKSINGLINKVNVSNIKHIIPELFQENLVRGRGLFARAIMKAQLASPGFTHIYCALLAIVNTKLPENGELVLKRVIYGFKRAYKRYAITAQIESLISINHQMIGQLARFIS
jgi:pre-mRNA-splicing factor CWC22